MSHSRRDFLVRTTCAALGAAAFQGTVRQFGLANLFATQNSISGNYRALVCVFLNGGNDANNMVIPNDAGYAAYSTARNSAGLAIAQGSLLALNNPPSMGGAAFGLHPSMPELQALFNSGKMSIVCNVGTLVHPMNQAQYMGNSVPKPYALFSHSDQIQAGQTARADIKIGSGWGGRVSDATLTCNAGSGFPTITSIAGTSTFCIGLQQRPLSIGTGPLNTVLVLNGFNSTPESIARQNSMDYLRSVDLTAAMIAGTSSTTQQAIDISANFSTDPTLTTVFPNTGIGNQLKQVAKVIKLNQSTLSLERQIFFVAQGGYDTHQNQIASQGNNFTDLSQALSAFYNATIELGLQNNITTFTLSDFGRTLQPSGSGGNAGSDHGWGNHQFVIGDSIVGGDFFGTPGSNGTVFPTLQTGGPDDTSTNGRGRWIPTSSVDQYGATLSKWFGVADIDMSTVFPLIGNFGTSDLGFMGAPPGAC
jgi:uncharacterized protein (DUF1501 family)